MPPITNEEFTLRSGLRREPDIRVLDPASLPPSVVVSCDVINGFWVPRSIAMLQVRMFDIRKMEIARQDVVALLDLAGRGRGVPRRRPDRRRASRRGDPQARPVRVSAPRGGARIRLSSLSM